MRKLLSFLLRMFLLIVAIPVVYFCVALILSFMTVERADTLSDSNHYVYLHSNGVHMDIALNKKDVSPLLLQDLNMRDDKTYLSFGWGDKNFYLNVPEWSDLQSDAVITALFRKSETLMHLTHYAKPQPDWIAVPVSDSELAKINNYLLHSFKTNADGNKIMLVDSGYGNNDDFYEAVGSYTLFNTCNTWVNKGFKQSGLKASVWTPFDFGLMGKYQ